ncbi:hypothetical protein MMC10_002953 [Thelotrema lepadinum]|nr:hypothetical protein [Thelotrema lepadinum]
MSTDNTDLVALVIAAVALTIAAVQLAQQLLATGYVIRKCDSIVTAGLAKGGHRKWHWQQFRFTVHYQSIVFVLPQNLYGALGINPAVQIHQPDLTVLNKAVKARPIRQYAQAGWVSFLEDLIPFSCIGEEHIGLKEESGDRIPEDLTVAPTKMDALTVLLCSIAMGMQVSRYSPTDNQIMLTGGTGSISTSEHPVLGGVLHYNIFSNNPAGGMHRARLHGEALRSEKGIWASAVFGRFRDRSYRPDFSRHADLRSRWYNILLREGWPQDRGDYSDTYGGAACFLTFAYVDCYLTVPPSIVRGWCAHFAETILKIQHWEIAKEMELKI